MFYYAIVNWLDLLTPKELFWHMGKLTLNMSVLHIENGIATELRIVFMWIISFAFMWIETCAMYCVLECVCVCVCARLYVYGYV